MKLGRKLHAGRTSAHDGDGKPATFRPELRLQRMSEQGAMEAVGLLATVQDMAPLGHARHAEIVGPAAEREHKMVVAEPPFAYDLQVGSVRPVRARAQGCQD